MRRPVVLLSLLLLPLMACGGGGEDIDGDPIEVLLLPSPGSPIVALRLVFEVGSIDDPPGKEGLAALTSLMIGNSGTALRSFKDLGEALYPMAASIGSWTDREVSIITGEVHRERLDEFTDLLLETVLQPGFDEADFERNREQLRAYLTSTLRSGNDELLGLEALQQRIFAGHPYEHAAQGTVEGLASLTLEDVRGFYDRHYSRTRLRAGIGGGYPDGYPERIAVSLAALPEGESRSALESPPELAAGRHFTLIEKSTDSVGLHFGFPLSINRSDDDFYPLMVANSFLGEHRTLHGRLMQQLREQRGLNYGDYSYIEHWPNPPGTNTPLPGFPRRQQFFSIWLRPVVPDTAHFALRNAIYELERLLEVGLDEEEFAATRDYLINYSKLWTQTLASRLGYAMDSAYYGIEPFIDEIEKRLSELTRGDVLAAIARHLQADDFQVVIVTADAAGLRQAIESERPSPMSYPASVSAEVEEADPSIETLQVHAASFSIVPVEELFQG